MSNMSELMNGYSNANEIAELKRQWLSVEKNLMNAISVLQEKIRIVTQKFKNFEAITKFSDQLSEEQVKAGTIAYFEHRQAFDAYQIAYRIYEAISAESKRISIKLEEALKQ